MRRVIVGYGEMFQALISGVLKTQHEIVGVFRQEYTTLNPIHRSIKDLLNPSSDYNFIRTHQLKEIKAKSVNSKEFIQALQELKTDLILVGSWGEKFSMQTINVPKKGCINVHPSLLPKYRGPNPYIQVLLNNETKTGITFHQMDVNYDTGAIVHQTEIKIRPNDTGATLKLRCCDIARNEVTIFLNEFSKKMKNPISQNEKEATYQNQITLGESIIDFTKETAEEIDRRIRALTPWLQCHICHNTEFFTFSNYKICPKNSKKPAGTIVKKTESSLFIVCKDGSVLEFSSVKLKRPLSNILTKIYLEKFVKTNDKVVV